MSVHAHWLTLFDNRVGAIIRQYRSPQLTLLAVNLTQIMNIKPISGLTLLLAAILGLRHHFHSAAFLLVNSFLLSSIGNALVKQLVLRPRPQIHHLVAVHSTSFPSGHAMGAMLVGGSLILISNQLLSKTYHRLALRSAIAALIILIGLSRIYVGVHFPSDVLAGWALGFCLLVGSQFIFTHYLGGIQ